ncbi:ABC transporter permease [Nocardioides zeae]|uniref:ABC transporter permease n=1 Tax=Nocardioides zeae TaxID=1457234 RepID=A0A6P0HFP2_9ACTN|nr:ABC transporter permease [Nocardioides zeae]NEN77144.1 ABC transporter permease [Nocardioides zeae]
MSTAVAPGIRVQLTRFAIGWIGAVVLLGCWQLATARSDSAFFPTPLEIVADIHERWFSAGIGGGVLTDAFFQDVTPSLQRLALGLLVAWAVGISLGVVLGRVRTVAEYLEPLLHFMRALPGPVLLPLALVLVGTGTSMRVSLIAFGAVWPILFNTYSAVRQVPECFIDNAKVARVSRPALLFRVILPAASTGIFAGLRVSTSLGIILLIASELVAATDGIGFGLTQSQRSFQFVAMWSFIVALSLLGYVANLILSGVETRILRWHRLMAAIQD